MHRKHVMLPSREAFFACERLLLFRCSRLRMEGCRMGTRASRAILLINSTVVIWYTILFRQNRTDRPIGCAQKRGSGIETAQVHPGWQRYAAVSCQSV